MSPFPRRVGPGASDTWCETPVSTLVERPQDNPPHLEPADWRTFLPVVLVTRRQGCDVGQRWWRHLGIVQLTRGKAPFCCWSRRGRARAEPADRLAEFSVANRLARGRSAVFPTRPPIRGSLVLSGPAGSLRLRGAKIAKRCPDILPHGTRAPNDLETKGQRCFPVLVRESLPSLCRAAAELLAPSCLRNRA